MTEKKNGDAFARELSEKTAEINRHLETFLPREEGKQKTVLSAMNYSFRAGGKRIRPMLMLETFHALGGKDDKIVWPFAAALEMIHTYSLIHDDLPAMDDDDLRRGKPTCHKAYGEAMAILAGDGLLNLAYETAGQALSDFSGDERTVSAFRILSRNAGVYGMIGGQTVDVESEKKQLTITRETLDFIYRLKTSALLCSAMEIGAVLSGASREDAEQIRLAAEKIGLAFQIRDDILDVTGDEATLGKPIGSDEKNEKSTYVTFEGQAKAESDAARLTEDAVSILLTYADRDSFLIRLTDHLVSRNH